MECATSDGNHRTAQVSPLKMYKYKTPRDFLFLSDINFPISVPASPIAANGYLAKNSEDQPEAVTERTTEAELNGHYVSPTCSGMAIVMEKTS